MSTIIESIEKEQMRPVPRFAAGDRVRVHFQVIEGSRTRTQVFEGVVIKRQGSGARETFTVRKQSFGVGVERTFPVHSPKIEQLEVAARGDVRRAKLYYLRDRVGKAARVAERRWGIDEDVLATEEGEAPTDSEGTSQDEAEVEVTAPEEETPDAEAEGTEAAAAAEETAEAEAEGEAEAASQEETEDGAGDEGGETESAEGESEAAATAEDESDGGATAEADADADAEGENDASDAGAEEQADESEQGPGEDEAPERDR